MIVVTYTLTVTLGENDDPAGNAPIVADMLRDAQSRIAAMLAGRGDIAITENRPRIHKAVPQAGTENHGASLCTYCHEAIRHLPAGQGWVHTDTDTVVGTGSVIS